MSNQFKLKRVPSTPEYHNSAGRLLRILEMLRSLSPYYETVASFYQEEKPSFSNEMKGQLYLEFMQLVSSAYQEFVNDLETTDTIPGPTKEILKHGLSTLTQIVYPINMGNTPRQLQDAEVAFLRTASSMLPKQGELSKEDSDTISESINQLRKTVDESDLPKSVRIALLEIVRLSGNALDHYYIHGPRGFKTAFKRMLSELMEIYLEVGPEKLVEKPWWKQAYSHVMRFDELAAKLLKYKSLIDSISKILLPL